MASEDADYLGRSLTPERRFTLLTVVVLPIAMVLAWFGTVLGLRLTDGPAVWTTAGVVLAAGGALLSWYCHRTGVNRHKTVSAVLVAALASVLWGIVLFFVLLYVSCGGPDSCFS